MGQTAVVVGVGPGLGGSLVRKLADENFTVIAIARHASSLEGFSDHSKAGRVFLTDCDATVPEEVEHVFAGIEDQYGPLKVAIFNAGAYERGTVTETDPADFERCWRVGLTTTKGTEAQLYLPEPRHRSEAVPGLRISRRRSLHCAHWPRAWRENSDHRGFTWLTSSSTAVFVRLATRRCSMIWDLTHCWNRTLSPMYTLLCTSSTAQLGRRSWICDRGWKNSD